MIGKTVGIESELINASLSPQQKSDVISSLQAKGHRVAMVAIFNQTNLNLKSAWRFLFLNFHTLNSIT